MLNNSHSVMVKPWVLNYRLNPCFHDVMFGVWFDESFNEVGHQLGVYCQLRLSWWDDYFAVFVLSQQIENTWNEAPQMLQLLPRFTVACIITVITSVLIFYGWKLVEVPQKRICNPPNGCKHAYLKRTKMINLVCDQSRGK